MIDTGLRRRKSFDEALKGAIYNKTGRNVILKKFKSGMPSLGMMESIDVNNLDGRKLYIYIHGFRQGDADRPDKEQRQGGPSKRNQRRRGITQGVV